MSGPEIVRILASARIPSSAGAAFDYELLHAEIRRPGSAAPEAAVLLLQAEGRGPAMIRPGDLEAVSAEWSRFTASLRERGGAPALSASGGRFGARGRLSLPASDAPFISAGPRKRIGPVPDAAPQGPAAPESYHVLSFAISAPPSPDDVVEAAKGRPRGLVVVAPAPVAARAEAFVSALKAGTATGLPADFTAHVVERRVNGRPVTHKQLRAEVAGALMRASGDLSSAVWILPE